MALDSIQNKYLEGEGSPEGVVKGKKGFTYKDTLTNDEYTSLGGDNWRKDTITGISLIKRSFTKLEDIIETSDLKEGEIVDLKYNVKDSVNIDASYETIYNYNKQYIEYKATQTDPYRNRMVANVATSYVEGDRFSVTFRVQENGIRQGSASVKHVRFFQPSSGFLFSVRENTNNTFVMYNTKFRIISIENELGKVDEIRPNEWVTVTLEIAEDSSLNISTLFTNTDRNAEIEILQITLKDEVINFKNDPNDRTFVSDSGNLSFSTSATYAPIIIRKDYVPLARTMLRTTNGIIKLIVKNNIISPSLFGLDTSLNNNFELENDCTDIIQYCLDSPYNVVIEPGKYYITRELTASIPKDIYMYGSNIPNYFNRFREYDDIVMSYLKLDKTSTVIYSDQNIDYFTIKNSNISVYNGVICTILSENHNRAAYKYDVRERIWGGKLVDINVVGSYMNLTVADSGTIGLYINLDEVVGAYTGNLTMIKVSGVIHSCGKGVYLPTKEIDTSTWINSLTFNIYMAYCKRFFHMQSGSIIKIDSMQQDGYGIVAGEDSVANILNIDNSEIDSFTFDLEGEIIYEGITMRRHSTGMSITGPNNSLVGKSLIAYNRGLVSSNSRDINYLKFLNNPDEVFIPSRSSSVISDVQNVIKYRGEDEGVIITFKGYDADDSVDGEEWFNNNLYSAEDIRNLEPLTENITSSKIISQFGLFTYRGSEAVNSFINYLGKPNAFAEISVPLPLDESNGRMSKIWVSAFSQSGILSSTLNKVQLILINTNEPFQKPYSETISVRTSKLSMQLYNPNIYTGDKLDSKYINLLGERPVSEILLETGVNLEDVWKSSTIGVDSNSSAVAIGDALQWNGTGWINKGTVSRIPASSAYFDHMILRFIGNIGAVDAAYVIDDICVIPQYNYFKPIITTYGGTIKKDLRVRGELDAANIKGVTPLSLSGTGPNNEILLNNINGTFYYMSSATSRVDDFIIGETVLNGFSEVLVNRATQPLITGADYKSSKGVPFVPSTDMIMRVENKGVPRGVWYWFEEI